LDEPLRACLTILHYPPVFGGTGIRWQRNLPYFAANGVLPMVVTVRPPEELGAPPEEPWPVHRVLNLDRNRLGGLRRSWEFRRFVRRTAGSIDVVHGCAGEMHLYGNLPLLRRLGIPVVLEMVQLGADDPLAISGRKLGRLRLRLLRQADAWISTTRQFAKRLAAVGIPAERFHVVSCGVDLESYRPRFGVEKQELRRRLGIPERARVAITVGQVTPRKGIDRTLRAWARRRPANASELLLIVGPDSARDGLGEADLRHRDELLAFAREHGIADRIRFTGRVGNVHEFMAAADLFVLPSRLEGRVTALVEALASGLPVVVSSLDGIGEEFVSPGQTGFVLRDPDDDSELAEILSRVLDDEQLRRKLGESARREAERRFPMEQWAARLSELYRELRAQVRSRVGEPSRRA
jgi:glycosyltransferase involved in cell wall biosynthesis